MVCYWRKSDGGWCLLQQHGTHELCREGAQSDNVSGSIDQAQLSAISIRATFPMLILTYDIALGVLVCHCAYIFDRGLFLSLFDCIIQSILFYRSSFITALTWSGLIQSLCRIRLCVQSLLVIMAFGQVRLVCREAASVGSHRVMAHGGVSSWPGLMPHRGGWRRQGCHGVGDNGGYRVGGDLVVLKIVSSDMQPLGNGDLLRIDNEREFGFSQDSEPDRGRVWGGLRLNAKWHSGEKSRQLRWCCVIERLCTKPESWYSGRPDEAGRE